MRKLFGLLAAVVFVAAAATSVFAQTSSTQEFTAEISFVSTNTTFGFALLAMTGNMPQDGVDVSTTEIKWDITTSTGIPASYVPTLSFRPVSAGNGDGINNTTTTDPSGTWFATSKAYAKIDCSGLPTGTSVLFYTANQNGTASATTYKGDPLVNGSSMAMPMAPMYGANTSTMSAGMPIAYRIVNTGVGTSLAGSTDTVAWSSVGSIDNLDISANQTPYGNFMTLDQANNSDPVNGYGAVLAGVTAGYSMIATDMSPSGNGGIRSGIGTVSDTDPTPVLNFAWPSDGTSTYMFFATSAFNAHAGYRYGTNKLTVDVVTE
jgi:hypothetical protein